MTDPQQSATGTFSVGDIVEVRRPDGTTAAGTLVEDFGDYLLPADILGRTWAPPHRWAIALNAGTLIFADDQDVTAPPAPPPTGAANRPAADSTADTP